MKTAVTTLVFCVAALLALGMVMLYSSSMTQAGAHYLTRQILWCAIGFVLCVAAASLDYHLLKKSALPLYVLAVILLALVWHLGDPHKGARRWFNLPGLSFQPSEFAKLALVFMIAWYAERWQRHLQTWWRGVAIPAAIIAVVLGLVFVEPDRGCAILLAAVGGALLLIAGVRWKYILPPVALGLVVLVVSILRDPLRMKRIFSWLYLEENKSGGGFQAYNAMLALGSGGWTGLGLGNGRQKNGFVPEHHTDFIYSIIGEELGLVATLAVILGFVLIVICGIYIAVNARDTFGFLLASGLTFLIGFQAFINIGVVTSALPNKGMPLPFISYGGSNLLAMLTCVGLLLSVARHARASERIGVPDADELPSLQPR